MNRPYRFEKDLDRRYDDLTEQVEDIKGMEKHLSGAIDTAEEMEKTYPVFNGVPGLLRGVLSDIADERARLEQMCDDMWTEMTLRGDV